MAIKTINIKKNKSDTVTEVTDDDFSDENDSSENNSSEDNSSEDNSSDNSSSEEDNTDHSSNKSSQSNKYSKKVSSSNSKKSSKSNKNKSSSHSDDEEEEEEPVAIDSGTGKKLKMIISKWITYDDKIKDLAKEAVVIKKSKKEIEEDIITILNKYNFGENPVTLGNDKIKKTVHKTRKSLTPDIIKKTLMEMIKNEEKVDTLINKMMDRRPIVEREYIKRMNMNDQTCTPNKNKK
jgi:hypothetical protein